MGVHIKIINGEKRFTSKVPIKFIAETMHTSTKFIQECLKQKRGKFANLGITIIRKYERSTFFITDKELYDTFGIEFYEEEYYKKKKEN